MLERCQENDEIRSLITDLDANLTSLEPDQDANLSNDYNG